MIIWLASYPKSGNTLLRSIIGTYLYSNDGVVRFNDLYKIEQFPSVEHFKKLNLDLLNEKQIFENFIEVQKLINKEKKLKFLKTHSSLAKIGKCNFTDWNNSLGAIYIVRDPRNVVKSFSNHYNLTIDNATDVMINPKRWLNTNNLTYKVFLGSWSINYNSWKQMKDKVFFVKYEDLVNRKKTTLLKIFKFIQNLGVENFEVDMIKLNKVIKTSDFKHMQNLEKKEDFKESVIDYKTKRKRTFFKYGPKNNWKLDLDKNNRTKIEDAFRNEMIELGYL